MAERGDVARARKARKEAWTPEMDEELRALWPQAKTRMETYAVFAARGMTQPMVKRRAKVLGLTVKFTPAEDAMIRKLYPRKKAKLLKAMGDRHTRHEILTRAHALRPKGALGIIPYCVWTPAEDAILKELWAHNYGLRRMSDALPGRSLSAMYRRGMDLKLPVGMPQGMVCVTDVAKKFGFEFPTTLRELKARGVVIEHLNKLSNRHAKRTAVDADDAEEAMNDYVKFLDTHSTLNELSRELKAGLSTIRSILKEAGLYKPGPNGLRQWVGPEVKAAIVSRLAYRRARMYDRGSRAANV